MKQINLRSNSSDGKKIPYNDLPKSVKDLIDKSYLKIQCFVKHITFFEIESDNGSFILPDSDNDLVSNFNYHALNMEAQQSWLLPNGQSLCQFAVKDGKDFGVIVVGVNDNEFCVYRINKI